MDPNDLSRMRKEEKNEKVFFPIPRAGSGSNDVCRLRRFPRARCTGRPYPDFVMIANGYGIPGRNVFTREELVPAIEEMLAADGPFLLDVHTGYEEHVLPMIPPGGDYTAIIME